MMEIRPYRPGDVLRIALPREGIVSEAIDALARAENCWAFTALDGDMVFASGGLLQAAPWRAMAWSVIAEAVPRRTLAAIRRRMRLQMALAEADGVTTIETEVAERFTRGHGWVRSLGFRLTGVVPGPDGGFLRYARWTPAAQWPGTRVRALLDLTERTFADFLMRRAA